MSEIIKVNTNELRKKANRMRNSLEVVIQKVNSLYSDNLQVIGENWKSKENYIYLNKLNNYLSNLNELVDSINNYIAFLNVASDEYDETMRQAMIKATSYERW